MRKLIALAVLLLAPAFAFADAVAGSLSFVFVNVVGNGTDLSNTTLLVATDSLTEAVGTGDFAGVPPLTSFGPMSLNQLIIGTGGGFALSNATWGTFIADGANLFTRTPTFLNIDMLGTFDPGPGLAGLTATPAVAHVTFDQTGPALSGAFTLDTVPEPVGLALFGSGLVLCGFQVRRMR